LDLIDTKTGSSFKSDFHASDEMSEKVFIIPPSRNRYLSEISETVRKYNSWTEEQAEIAEQLYQLQGTKDILSK
jgi:methylmalonyl-CoA mutase